MTIQPHAIAEAISYGNSSLCHFYVNRLPKVIKKKVLLRGTLSMDLCCIDMFFLLSDDFVIV